MKILSPRPKAFCPHFHELIKKNFDLKEKKWKNLGFLGEISKTQTKMADPTRATKN